MTYQNKPNTGKLFVNEYKEKDSHPDRKGSLYLDREFLAKMLEQSDELVVVEITAWENVSATGKEYLGLKVQAPRVVKEKPEAKPEPKPEPKTEAPPEDDSDIPF
jgi:hypothetical protein